MGGLVLGTHFSLLGRYNIRRVEEWGWGKGGIVHYKMLLISVFKWTCGERSQHLISTSTETSQKRTLIFVRCFYFPWKYSVSSANHHSPADFSHMYKLSRFKKRFDFILPNVHTHTHAYLQVLGIYMFKLSKARSIPVVVLPHLFPSLCLQFTGYLSSSFLRLSHWQNPKLTEVKRSIVISIHRLRVSLLFF